MGDAGGLFDEIRIHPAAALDHLPDGLLDFAHRREVRVVVVGQVVVARLGAQAAVDAGLHIGFQSSAGLLL